MQVFIKSDLILAYKKTSDGVNKRCGHLFYIIYFQPRFGKLG